MLCLAALLGALTHAHPLHTTFTEIVADPATHVVTVTVRSFSDDLARAIGAPAPIPGGAVALPDSALARYVTARLTLLAAGGNPMVLRYAGQRQSADLSWISFTIAAPAGLSGIAITDRLQVELYPDQVNLVQASYADRRETLLFTSGDGPRTLP